MRHGSPRRSVRLEVAVVALGTLLSSATSAAGWCIDPAYGDGGLVQLDVGGGDNVAWSAQGLSVFLDGRAIVGGSIDGGFFASRLDSSGQVDRAFGTAGLAFVTFPQAAYVEFNALAVFSDGTIALGGESKTVSGQNRITLARLLPSGALDPTFGAGGTLIPTFLPDPEVVNGLVALLDGRLLIGGHGRTRGSDSNGFVTALARDGGLDRAFGNVGVTDIDFGARDEFGGAIVLDAQQRIMVPMVTRGPTGDDFGIARLVTSGLFDGTFMASPLVGRGRFDVLGGDDECTVLTSLVDGRIVAGGEVTFADGGSAGVLLRLTTSGLVDLSFGDAGTSAVPGFRTIRAVLALTDGTLVVGGALGNRSNTDLGVAFLDSTGALLDAGFTNPVHIDVASGVDGVRTLGTDGFGRILAYGEATRGSQNDAVVFRLVDCALVDAGLPVDAGAADAGSSTGPDSGFDAGTVDAGVDAGATSLDGGTSTDAGPVTDGGVGPSRSFGVGCGCSQMPFELAALALVLAQGLRRIVRARLADSSSA